MSNPRSPRTLVGYAHVNGVVGGNVFMYGFDRAGGLSPFVRTAPGLYNLHSTWFRDPATSVFISPRTLGVNLINEWFLTVDQVSGVAQLVTNLEGVPADSDFDVLLVNFQGVGQDVQVSAT